MRALRGGVVSLLVILVTFPAFGEWMRRATTPDGPVIIFLVDTLRSDRLSVYGASHATTPAADRLAREGTVFERAYALSSWTGASVGTLFTSLLPSAAGTLDRNGKLDPAVASLPQLFHDRGWTTAAFVGNAAVSPRTGFTRGFDVFESVDTVEPGFEGHCRARAVMDPAIRFVERQDSPHYFLYIHVLDPHLPFNLEPKYLKLFARTTADGRPNEREALLLDYDRAIRQADDQFARLVGALRARGVWDRATVIYTADHGEEFYEHGGRGHGDTLYEEQIRVPLIVKYSRGSRKAARRQEIVSLADVTPTLAELFTLPRDPAWIGASLLAPPPGRALYFTEEFGGNRLYALRAETEKLIVRLYPKFDERRYDLSRDPGEKLGKEIACGTSPPDDAQKLLVAAETWRGRDVSSFPRIDFEKVTARAVRLILTMALPDVPRPFLTLDAYCRYESLVRSSALTLAVDVPAGEAFGLSIAADEKGEFPRYRLSVYDVSGKSLTGKQGKALVRSAPVERPHLRDSETEEQIQQLRNLGYLGGATSKRRP